MGTWTCPRSWERPGPRHSPTHPLVVWALGFLKAPLMRPLLNVGHNHPTMLASLCTEVQTQACWVGAVVPAPWGLARGFKSDQLDLQNEVTGAE